jgi:hypothetical protein
MTAQVTEPGAPAAPPMTPKEFVRRLKTLNKTASPEVVDAFYEAHGRTVAPVLRGRDRVLVADIMHMVDAAIDWRPEMPTHRLRPATVGAAEQEQDHTASADSGA